MTHPHAALIARFYDAFQRRDAAAMAACYHRDVHFTDEVFPDLRGPQAGAMWAMLCARGKDLRVEPSAITADDAQGRARWDAWYTFSGSGRPVHNIIQAEFGFRDGLIVRHVDRFDFQRWARQALGVSGLVLGGTRFMRRKVQTTAARSLAVWMAAPR
ncbi:MAG: nuclear transport factor 2 family protein [Gemmatimonadetes bacterium]|nr:nuclear transport factor 2 family protein [Gemmatimonadota bacterium]